MTDTNSDAPTADVPSIGPSEVLAAIGAASALLTMFFGHDFGLGQNAQGVSVIALGLITVGTSIARAIKHHGAAHANAAVYIAQLKAVSDALANSHIPEQTPETVADGVRALNAGSTELPTEPEGDAAP